MADDWNKYLPNEWGGISGNISYWQGRFNDPTYNPKSWYEHADRWLCELLNKGAYDNEWKSFFDYLHFHFKDCKNQLNQNQLTGWYNNLNQREQNLQQNLSNFEDALKKLNQQKAELAEKSRRLNLMEERLNRREDILNQREDKQPLEKARQLTNRDNQLDEKACKREFELKILAQRRERIESNKNNSFYASSDNDHDNQSNVNPYNKVNQVSGPIQQPAPAKTAPTQKVSISDKDEFNEMMNKTGQDFRQARQDFIKNRKVRAFSCSNVSARMREPVPEPTFAEVNEVSDGEYWAVYIQGNKFAVFPNVKNYNNNYHYERAMGDVFDSNFVSGKVYKNISVEQPAIFDCDGLSWRLSKKGKLRLG